MAVLLVLFILVLGWRYTEAIPAERAALKRSNNWEGYVRLARHGLILTFWGILLYAFLFVIGLVALMLVSLIFRLFGISDVFTSVAVIFRSEILGIGINELVILLLSFAYCEVQIKQVKQRDKTFQLDTLKQQDAVLNLIIEAVQQQKLVKVSLKSRKVYIGIISDEQFERLDLDNLTLIPFYSGHRDKDALQLVLDSDYLAVYEKYGIYDEKTEEISTEKVSKLEDFRLVIRLNEVESISFFETDYYFSDFNDN